jgi:hypothetical protein
MTPRWVVRYRDVKGNVVREERFVFRRSAERSRLSSPLGMWTSQVERVPVEDTP